MHYIMKMMWPPDKLDEVMKVLSKNPDSPEVINNAKLLGGDAFGYATMYGHTQIRIFEVEDAKGHEFYRAVAKMMAVYRNIEGLRWTIRIATPSEKALPNYGYESK
jgi:hypothetical protein